MVDDRDTLTPAGGADSGLSREALWPQDRLSLLAAALLQYRHDLVLDPRWPRLALVRRQERLLVAMIEALGHEPWKLEHRFAFLGLGYVLRYEPVPGNATPGVVAAPVLRRIGGMLPSGDPDANLSAEEAEAWDAQTERPADDLVLGAMRAGEFTGRLLASSRRSGLEVDAAAAERLAADGVHPPVPKVGVLVEQVPDGHQVTIGTYDVRIRRAPS